MAAGVIVVKDVVTYDRDGEVVKRFGFHHLWTPLACDLLKGRAGKPCCGSGNHAPCEDGT